MSGIDKSGDQLGKALAEKRWFIPNTCYVIAFQPDNYCWPFILRIFVCDCYQVYNDLAINVSNIGSVKILFHIMHTQ